MGSIATRADVPHGADNISRLRHEQCRKAGPKDDGNEPVHGMKSRTGFMSTTSIQSKISPARKKLFRFREFSVLEAGCEAGWKQVFHFHAENPSDDKNFDV